MPDIPKRNRYVEDYKNLHCNITPKQDFVTITIIDNKDNDFSDLFKILNKYPNTTVDIRNIHTLIELNTLCDILSSYNYEGNITLNLTSKTYGPVSIDGLNNDSYINIESLPENVKIKGFYNANIQSDFTSWAHNLNDSERITLMKHLTDEDKYIYCEQDKVIKSFYSELSKAYPELMIYDMQKRFETAFMYVMHNFPYAYDSLDDKGLLRTECGYFHDAVETYKRREGVCNGRANLLTLVTNNSLLKCNSSEVDGDTEPHETRYGKLPHCWNVLVHDNGTAYYYDLGYKKFTRREIHDLGLRRINKIYNSKVQELYKKEKCDMETNKTKQIVELAFREITKKGYFDIEKGNVPIPGVWNESMSTIPNVMTKYVNECGFGCCFVFSAYMMEILNKYGINNYMIGTIEDTGTRASVMYEDNGEFYVANPVEDIEFFTEHIIDPEERAEYYKGNSATMVIDGKEHNDSRYTLDEFCKKYGTMWIIGSMNKDSQNTLGTQFSSKEDRTIMPPEVANYDVKRLLKK